MIKLLSKNILIYGSSNALKSLVPIFMLPILTTYLSISDFGILSLIETTILFITPLILLNINAAINVEYFKVEHYDLRQYITNALSLSFFSFIFISLLFFFFQNLFASIFHISNNLILWIVLFSALRVVTSIVLGLYQSRQESIKFAIYTLVQTIVDFSLSYILVVVYNYGYIGRLEGIYISFFLFSLFGIYLLYKMDYLSKITFKYTKDILNFGVPLIPHAISGTVIAMSDRYFISYYIGNDQVGVYAIAYQISALMLLFGMSVNQAWTPILFKLLKERRIEQVYKFTIYLCVLFFIFLLGIFFLKDILFFIFVNEKFYIAKEYFNWLLVGFLFQSLYFLVANLLFFEKKTKMLARMTILGAILNIVLNYFFIDMYGTIGVAYSTAITWGIFFLSILILDIRYIKRFYL